jgi:hypothetical protein
MSIVFGEIRQIAFVAENIDQAMRYWSETLGVGPFFIKRRVALRDFKYRGRAAPPPEISIALANSGALQIELIAQHDERPSIYRDFLAGGRRGLQHVSSWLTRAEFDRRKAALLARGLTLAQEATIVSSGVRLAYFATDNMPDGTIFEIADLMEPGQRERIQFICDQAAAWDGRDAVREVEK